MLDAHEASEKTAAETDRANRRAARRAQDRCEVRDAEQRQEGDRDPGAGVLEPRRRAPLGSDRGHRHRDRGDDQAVPGGKQQPRPARKPRAVHGVEAREAVDRREVIRIEAVLQPEEEHDRDEGKPMGGQSFHAHFFMKKSSHSFSHLPDSSSTVAGSTSVKGKLLSLLFTRVLAGTRPMDSKSCWPSGESTKSANSSAAFGCGACAATPIPWARATTGFTGSQSMGAPLRFSDSALAL